MSHDLLGEAQIHLNRNPPFVLSNDVFNSFMDSHVLDFPADHYLSTKELIAEF